MFTFIKIMGVILAGGILLTLYPAYLEWISTMNTAANEIYTPSTLDTILFAAAPIIGLILIVWVLFKMLTAKKWNIR